MIYYVGTQWMLIPKGTGFILIWNFVIWAKVEMCSVISIVNLSGCWVLCWYRHRHRLLIFRDKEISVGSALKYESRIGNIPGLYICTNGDPWELRLPMFYVGSDSFIWMAYQRHRINIWCYLMVLSKTSPSSPGMQRARRLQTGILHPGFQTTYISAFTWLPRKRKPEFSHRWTVVKRFYHIRLSFLFRSTMLSVGKPGVRGSLIVWGVSS